MTNNKNISRIIKYFFRDKRAALSACLMCVLGLAVGIVTPICNKLIQDSIIPNEDMNLFVSVTFVVLILNVVSMVTSFLVKKIMINSGINITSNIRKDIVKMNTLSNKNANNRGEVVINATKFLEEANCYLINYMYLIFDSILKFMFYIPFFIVYGRWLAIIMICVALIAWSVMEIAVASARKRIAISKRVDTERYDYTLKLFKAMDNPSFKEDEELCYREYYNKVKKCDIAWERYAISANLYSYIFSFIWDIGKALCFCLAFKLISVGSITVALFVAFNSYIEQLQSPLSNVLTYKQNADQYNVTLTNVFTVLDDEDLRNLK